MQTFKTILGIETSCDETACSVGIYDNNRVKLLSNVISSSAPLHIKYGGILPEQAAREQIRMIIPVVKESLELAKLQPQQIDAIAVTQGPGLIGSLLIGVETAKVLSQLWEKPIIPVNHLLAHFYANWIENDEKETLQPTFPFIGLLISGGHSDLLLMKDHGVFTYLGGTRDDAAGECFDKCARILGLPYPGGPQISKRALLGNPKIYPLPIPMAESNDLDFSFSGLKTAVLYLVERIKKEQDQKELNEEQIANLCASIEEAIAKSLSKKTITAAKIHNIEHIVLAGGVAANATIVNTIRRDFTGNLTVPKPALCTDNAAMVTAAAFFLQPQTNPLNIQANPNISLN